MTLPPNYGGEYIKCSSRSTSIWPRNTRCRRIPFLLSDVVLRPGLMQQDGIHPTAEGNEIVAKTVLRYLKPLLLFVGEFVSRRSASAIRSRSRAMALQAKRADVCQIALAAAFHHGNDVIGIPKTFPRVRGAQSPIEQGFQPGSAAQALQLPLGMPGNRCRNRRRCRGRAPDLFAKIARIGAQTPFLHAPVRAETSCGLWELPGCTSGTDFGHSGPWEVLAGPPNRLAWFSWYSSLGCSLYLQKIPKTEQDGAKAHLTW